MQTAPEPVVVGVDGSPASLVAAGYAAWWASAHGAPLRCVLAYDLPVYTYTAQSAIDVTALVDDRLHADALATLDRVAAEIRAAYPDLTGVQTQLIPGGGAGVLVEESRNALATIAGARGHAGFAELLLGSVSTQLTAHGHGPIIVVRPGPDTTDTASVAERSDWAGPILVGIDGSDHAARALEFAVAEAVLRRQELTVVHAYTPVLHPTTGDAHAEGQAEALRLLAEKTLPWRTKHPDLLMHTEAVSSGNVEQVLLDRARSAALTVVGSRGHGGFTGMLLGSTSRALTQHSTGPVAVIHPKSS